VVCLAHSRATSYFFILSTGGLVRR